MSRRRAVVYAAGFGGAGDLPAVDLVASPVGRGLLLLAGIVAAAALLDRLLWDRWQRSRRNRGDP